MNDITDAKALLIAGTWYKVYEDAAVDDGVVYFNCATYINDEYRIWEMTAPVGSIQMMAFE